MSVGAAWRQKVALSILGPSKSDMIPDTLWLGFRTATANVPGRVAVDTSAWAGDGDGVTNTQAIDGGQPGAVTITEAVLWDAATGGNRVLTAALDEPTEVGADEVAIFPAGALTFEVA